ncbi:hypothetical protein KIW84_063748 [Lathyrus oleraceus]|uniref:Protein TIFY n=1 Tax=Pisum sativum TaxID=3888 RepID=A0A9D5A576_PEA|nr:hypothetical protein KIW84_063748 [Pisum sativum]
MPQFVDKVSGALLELNHLQMQLFLSSCLSSSEFCTKLHWQLVDFNNRCLAWIWFAFVYVWGAVVAVGSILNISCFTAGTCVEGHGRLRMNEMFPDTNQFTIFYNGNICSYNGIPAEKMQGIMLLVAAAAKSTETKNTMKQSPVPSPIPSSPPSPVADNVTSPQALCFPYPSSPKNEGG